LGLRRSARDERTLAIVAAISASALRHLGRRPMVVACYRRVAAGRPVLGTRGADLVPGNACARADLSDFCHWWHVRRRRGTQRLSPAEPSCVSALGQPTYGDPKRQGGRRPR
jgi:hypothetical protein